MYMIATKFGTPLATGYDENGDPLGYTYATLDEAKAILIRPMKRGGYNPARMFRIYELTKVYGEE